MTNGGGSGLVTIFGGSGFVGRYAVQALAKRGWRVRAAVRRPDLAGHLQPMGAVGQIMPIQANLRYSDSIARAVHGAEVVINCVGIPYNLGEQTFNSVHVEGARAVAKAARGAGARRLVHISALGANQNSSSRYASSKAKGVQAVLAEFPSAVILRPSLVFGPEDQFFNRFAAMARFSPVLPAIGGGKTKFQPIFAGDLGQAIATATEGRVEPGKIYELGGPEVFTFKELLERIAQYCGRSSKPFPIPYFAAKIMAVVAKLLPTTLRPIAYDQVRLLQTAQSIVSDIAEKEGRTLKAFNIALPTAIEAVVPDYLERFKPKGHYSHYRG
ncbi:MAG: complex I NDUFA9 subunit family protein [Hyphomicrobiaceae bacterium]|nr:MAG: complex I NDUFA9 subunit family protein [Hyphomicrobiaceae bacterium]